jgi:hypothetical protein
MLWKPRISPHERVGTDGRQGNKELEKPAENRSERCREGSADEWESTLTRVLIENWNDCRRVDGDISFEGHAAQAVVGLE